MKTYSKTKTTSYKNVIIEDEGGLDILRVTKRLSQSLSALHLLHLSILGTVVRTIS